MVRFINHWLYVFIMHESVSNVSRCRRQGDSQHMRARDVVWCRQVTRGRVSRWAGRHRARAGGSLSAILDPRTQPCTRFALHIHPYTPTTPLPFIPATPPPLQTSGSNFSPLFKNKSFTLPLFQASTLHGNRLQPLPPPPHIHRPHRQTLRTVDRSQGNAQPQAWEAVPLALSL